MGKKRADLDMPGIKRATRKTELRREILQRASELFKQKGYQGVTMDDIAQGLGISKLIIYYYFKGKEDLLYCINDIGHTKVLKVLEQILATKDPPETKLRKAIINYIDVLLSEMTLDTIAFRQNDSLSPENRRKLIKKRDRYDQILREIIKEGTKQGVFIDCDHKLANFAIMGAVSNIVRWYSPKGPLGAEQIANFFADFLIRGLLRTPVAG